MVLDRDAVRVEASPRQGGNVLFTIFVAPKDLGKVIGKHGRIARSLRIITGTIGKENGESFALDVGGGVRIGVEYTEVGLRV